MARKPRIHSPGGLYHVIFRGNGGQSIFLNDEDRYRFYLLLQEGTCRFGYRVHAFCLMPNHIHLALQVADIPLSRSMQNLSFRFTRWINRCHGRTGHLFQGRYKSVLVDSDSYLLELIRYIHLNPVRAGIVKVPGTFKWSSHRAYLGKESLTWLTTEYLLANFGESTGTAIECYKRFVLDKLGEGHRPVFYGVARDSRILGNDCFIEKCLSESDSAIIDLTVTEIVNTVCQIYGINESDLSSASQRRNFSEARAAIGWLAQETGCGTLTEVGRIVRRDVGSISSAVRRLSIRMSESPELSEHIRTICTNLQAPILQA